MTERYVPHETPTFGGKITKRQGKWLCISLALLGDAFAVLLLVALILIIF